MARVGARSRVRGIGTAKPSIACGTRRGRADALHDKDQLIRKEERFDAKQDGSHITGAEQKAINQQENEVSGKSP